jgi:hypothetical protein
MSIFRCLACFKESTSGALCNVPYSACLYEELLAPHPTQKLVGSSQLLVKNIRSYAPHLEAVSFTVTTVKALHGPYSSLVRRTRDYMQRVAGREKGGSTGQLNPQIVCILMWPTASLSDRTIRAVFRKSRVQVSTEASYILTSILFYLSSYRRILNQITAVP